MLIIRDPISNFAYYLKLGSSKLFYYDHSKDTFYRTTISKGEEIYEYDTAMSPKGIFIAGGYRYSKERPIKVTYECNAITKQIEERPGLITPRQGAALIAYEKSLFYCIGGYYKDKADNIILSDCERYDYAYSKWSPISPISKGRCFVSLFIVNKEIYCIGGKYWNEFTKDFEYSGRIEKLSVEYDDLGWEVIKFENNLGGEGKMHFGATSISKTQILIFGGESKIKHDECYCIDIKKNVIEATEKLAAPDSFGNWKPAISAKHIYVFSIYFVMHICNIAKRKWRMISKDAVKWVDV